MMLDSWWCSLELWGMTGLDAAFPKVSCLEAVSVHSPCGTQDFWLSLLRNHLHELLAEHRHRNCGERTGVSTTEDGHELEARAHYATCSHQPIYYFWNSERRLST